MSSPFGIMTLEASVLAIGVATSVYSTVTVSSPISDSSSLPTHMIGILPITGQIDESFLRALGAGEFSTPPEDTSKIVPSPTPSTPAHDSLPVALWVKGKEGQQVLSPFTGGIVDVSGFPPGSEARCPYRGKIFLVPTKP
jgi:hypothetical protein